MATLDLHLNEYQRIAAGTDQNATAGRDGLEFPLLGLFGETGSLLSELKKKQRDKDSYFAYEDTVIEESGDTLWYLANIAGRVGITLEELANCAEQSPQRITTFAEMQESLIRPNGINSTAATGLLELASAVGKLVARPLLGTPEDRPRALADLAAVLSCLVQSASDAKVGMPTAAKKNLDKITSRWPVVPKFTPLFDEDFPAEEQLPRELEITLAEKTYAGRTFVMQQCRGINIGDRLTDNRSTPDDYRFHDVFHLAYAGILGWSPVTRALFKLKRKSNPHKDENEDGARAVLLEECISTWVFNRGGRFNFYEHISSVDYDLLKGISTFVRGYEVEICPLWMWERAILEGYKIFRFMQEHRSGVVTLDLRKRTLEVRARNT